ncbi:unnamed protein product [Camellia sinensis]
MELKLQINMYAYHAGRHILMNQILGITRHRSLEKKIAQRNFLHMKKETPNMLEISSQMVGRKDTSKSVFDVWAEIFQKRKVKRERKSTSV